MNLLPRVAVGAAIVAVLGFAAFQWAFYGNSAEVIATADRLQAPDGWELVLEDVTAPSRVCLDGGTCPSVLRQWSTPSTLTRSEFESVLSESELDLAIDSDCVPSALVLGEQIACSASGSVDGFNVIVSVIAPSPGELGGSVVLDIRQPVA